MTRPLDADAIARRLGEHFPQLAAVPEGVFVVGGALRDVFLGRRPVDVDLAAADGRGAAEAFAKNVRARVIELGRERFRTWRVTAKGHVYDFNDIVGPSIDVDLARRDFTINAMAFDPRARRLIDPHGGEDDVRGRCLRMVRASNFADDPLRVLKGVRMAVALRFGVEPATLDAMREYAPRVADVAAERVTYELELAFRADAKHAVDLLNETGLDRVLFGAPVPAATRESLGRTKVNDSTVAFLTLLDPARVDEFAERWRWSRELRRGVQTLGRAVSRIREANGDEGAMAIALHDAGRRMAKRIACALRVAGVDGVASDVERLVVEKGDAIFHATPLLTGHEIAEISGRARGPAIGAIKRALLEKQIRGEIVDRAGAEAYVRNSR